MSSASRVSKLSELRQKTDRQLLLVVRIELGRGLALAGVAATKGSALFAEAERTYARAKTLLPKIYFMNRDERRQLEVKLKDLRAALDRVPSERIQRYAAGSAL